MFPIVKHTLLFNDFVNACGEMFIFADNFSEGGGQKIAVGISKYILEAIESVGPSNVLQVVTDKDKQHNLVIVSRKFKIRVVKGC